MILVIDANKKISSNLSDIFYYMGFLSRGIAPSELDGELTANYRAVVLTSPRTVARLDDLIGRIRTHNPSLPVFAITDESTPSGSLSLFNAAYERGGYAARLAERMIEYCDDHKLPIPGHYSIAGLDVSADRKSGSYDSLEIPFTKTECMILRYLVRSYPEPALAEDIRKYAYRPTRLPELANIRTHISIINKKFRSVTGSNVIYPAFGVGYALFEEARANEPATV